MAIQSLAIDWTLYAGARNLEAKVTLDWHERLKMIKFSFPVDVETPVATFETPYGILSARQTEMKSRDRDGLTLAETGAAERYTGLTVINDAKYGYSVNGTDMRISVVRSAPFAHHIPKVLDMNSEHIWMDQGIQTFQDAAGASLRTPGRA